MTEDEMVGWHPRLNAYEFEQDPGVGEGQGSERLLLNHAKMLGFLAPEEKIQSRARDEAGLLRAFV